MALRISNLCEIFYIHFIEKNDCYLLLDYRLMYEILLINMYYYNANDKSDLDSILKFLFKSI